MAEQTAKGVSRLRPRRAAAISRWDMETDVAVLGCGGGGVSAAIEARDGGADVVIFEAASGPGGSTALSAGVLYLGGGTRLQKVLGFEDTVENMYKYLMVQDEGCPQDEDRVKAYCDGAIEHFNWLEKLGVPFKESFYGKRNTHPENEDGLMYTGNESAWPHNTVASPVPRGHGVRAARDKGGAKLMEVLLSTALSRGVQLKCDARARGLILDDDGSVAGVVVMIDNREHLVRARKGVIICTGGFIMNDTMMKNYSPRYRALTNRLNGNPNDDGAGILMAMAAGAGTVNMHEGHITTPYYPPEEMLYGILVNQHGQRFVNEDSYNGRTGTYCANQILDSSSRVYAIGSFTDFANFRSGHHVVDVAATGDSAAELEAELKLVPGTLVATIESYNRNAAEGNDPFWHKDRRWLKPLLPPLVALDLTPGHGAWYPNFSLGGLQTLPTGEVLDLEGNIIPGLYAAGRAACGVARYSATYWSGLSVGDATFFGRRAGKSAVARRPA